MSDVQHELAQLRRDVDELMARLGAGKPIDPTDASQPDAVSEACLEHLRAMMESKGTTRGIGIYRVVVMMNEGGTSIRGGRITSTDAEDFRRPAKLRASVAALAADPLAVRVVRKLAELFLDGRPTRMKKTEMAAALGATEDELERSLHPLVADDMLLWRKNAAGEEIYELHHHDPHVLLVQSLE